MSALAGRVMIERTDLVVAVWDGKVANLPGGTGHTVATALAMGTPVLVVDPAAPGRWSILTRPEELLQPRGEADGGAPDLARLEAIIRAAVVVEGWSPAQLEREVWRPRSSRAFGLYRRIERLFRRGRRRARLAAGSITRRLKRSQAAAQQVWWRRQRTCPVAING